MPTWNDWFPPLDSAARASYPVTAQGKPYIAAMYEDVDGHLWVVILIMRRKPEEVGMVGAFRDRSLSEEIIEILDPGTREVARSERSAGFPMIDGDLVFSSYSMTGQLVPLLDVWTYRPVVPNE